MNNETNKNNFKCGYVAILGKPNVGKSTLMNKLIGQKVSITSKKAQTTRHKIIGIYTDSNSQIIFLDLPGVQKIKMNPINNKLNNNATRVLKDVDLILFTVECKNINKYDYDLLKYIPKNKPVILVMNKYDKIKKNFDFNINELIQNFNQENVFNTHQAISAKHSINLNKLLEKIKLYLPINPAIYPNDMVTDKSTLFLVQETIREKIYRYLCEEIPYTLNVEIESFKKLENMYEIHILIIVNKNSQKLIVIGKNGEKLKKISTEARIDLEKILNYKVFLKIWVKVKSTWIEDVKFLKELDLL